MSAISTLHSINLILRFFENLTYYLCFTTNLVFRTYLVLNNVNTVWLGIIKTIISMPMTKHLKLHILYGKVQNSRTIKTKDWKTYKKITTKSYKDL